MLTRRIAEHLQKQDWTAIAIEFLIVFVGIYAAFALERWRELETERSTFQNLIGMLHLELEEKLPAARNSIDAYNNLNNQQASVMKWLNGDQPPAQFTEEMCVAAFRSLVLNWSATRLETGDLIVTREWAQSVQDTVLQRHLLALGSLQDRTERTFDRFVLQIVNISDSYPELLRRRDASPEDYRQGLECNAAGMRASQAFKNQLFGNIGRQAALLELRRRELELLETIEIRVGQLRN